MYSDVNIKANSLQLSRITDSSSYGKQAVHILNSLRNLFKRSYTLTRVAQISHYANFEREF